MNFSAFLFYVGSPVIAGLIFFLNIIALVVLVRQWRRKQRSDSYRGLASTIFLINQSASDLLVGSILITIKIINACLKREELTQNKILNTVYDFFLYWFLRFSIVASVFNLLALTFERVLATRKPLRCHLLLTPSKAKITCLTIWIITFLITTLHYKYSPTYTLDFMYPAVVIPAGVVFASCYLYIFVTIRYYSRPPTNDINLELNRANTFVLKREARLFRFVVLVIVTFMICWTPLCVTTVIPTRVNSTVSNIAFVLAFCNSAINPMLYLGFTFRTESNRTGCLQRFRLKRTRSLVSTFQTPEQPQKRKHETVPSEFQASARN